MDLQPITSLQPFIDHDIHTVPLNGKGIHRTAKGKKEGYSFITDWQRVCSAELNETSTVIGGLMPVEIVAIDCDCKESYDLLRQLDKNNTAFMDSIGKLDPNGNPLECGTILYKRTDDSPASFRTTNGYSIDYYSGTGMVFLPTLANETKTTWLECQETGELYNQLEQKIEFKPMPQTVINLLALMNHQEAKDIPISATKTAHKNRGFLGKAFEHIDFSKEAYFPLVTKILTPYEYRTELYKKQGHLHPNDIAKGSSGHMYLFKISCILASDNTVDKELFVDVLNYLNDLWDEPYETKKLLKTIIKPILSGSATNATTGEPYWEYDENWEQVGGYTIVTKYDSTVLDVFYDDIKRTYYTYSPINNTIEPTLEINKLVKHLKSISTATVKVQELEAEIDVVRSSTHPTKDFGYFNDDTQFNLFRASEALKIMHNPASHEANYKVPNEFIDYMNHFIPVEEQRIFLLRFLKTKLMTFNYSPIVPYIIGVQGSGKNLLITILKTFLGSSYVLSDVSGTQFLEKYNDWLCDRYFVQLNELSESLTDKRSRSQAQGMLKNYTGSTDFEVRAMNSNYYTYSQTATFIMTANDNPMAIEDTDRRLLYIGTPNAFDFSPQCLASDPVSVYHAILNQVNDIAYWLATEIESLDDREYIRAPDVEGKQQLIFDSLNTSTKIAWGLYKGEFEMLEEFLLRPDCIFLGNDKIGVASIVQAYEEHGQNENADSIIKGAMKAQGFKLMFGTGNKGYYEVQGLADFCPAEDDIASVTDLDEEGSIRT